MCSHCELMCVVIHVCMCGPVETWILNSPFMPENTSYSKSNKAKQKANSKWNKTKKYVIYCCGFVEVVQPAIGEHSSQNTEWEQWVSRKEDAFLGMSAPFSILELSVGKTIKLKSSANIQHVKLRQNDSHFLKLLLCELFHVLCDNSFCKENPLNMINGTWQFFMVYLNR